MKVLIFVSSHCPHCPNAERVVKKVVPDYYDYGLELDKIRTNTSYGEEMSSRYGVMSTPTIIILDDEGVEVKRMVGVPSESNFRKDVERILGLRKSFLSKIFG